MNFVCLGNLSHVFMDSDAFKEHLFSCFFMAVSTNLYECKFYELHLFRSLPKKLKHESMCPFRKKGIVDNKREKIMKYFDKSKHDEFKKQIDFMKKPKKER